MELVYRQHAVKRMHERCITEEEEEHAIATGAVIENYPDDTPYPSVLCENCGEVYHDAAVTRSLLQQADQAANGGVEIDVRRYAAA